MGEHSNKKMDLKACHIQFYSVTIKVVVVIHHILVCLSVAFLVSSGTISINFRDDLDWPDFCDVGKALISVVLEKSMILCI